MNVETLRENRYGATVIFTKFILLKSKHNTSLFCCFEGDDSKYYGWRIENILNFETDNLHFFNCGGKMEVLRFYQIVNKNEYYKEVKLAYFVDKDFDESIIEKYKQKIYETPCYSIENFYTTIMAFKRILKSEFNIDECDDDFQKCLDIFINRQKEFHEKMTLFNAWLFCHRDLSKSDKTPRLNLSDFNLKRLIPKINLMEVVGDYDKKTIAHLFPEASIISDEVLESKIDELKKLDPQVYFRGKFEIDFLYNFIEAIKSELKKPDGVIKKRNGVHINISKKNMISELSQYADTPDGLKKYLAKFK